MDEEVKKDSFLKAFSKYAVKKYDNWQNSVSGFGGNNDPMSLTSFQTPNSFFIDHVTLAYMYRTDWLTRRIVNILPNDATSKGIKFNTEDPNIVGYINDSIDKFNIMETFNEALIDSRLFGGSIVIIGAIDGEDISQPLNENNIRDITHFTKLDRHQVHIVGTNSNPLELNFGQPELYSLQPITGHSGFAAFLKQLTKLFENNKIIHASRVIKFDGPYTPDLIKVHNGGWNDSLIININAMLKRYGSSIQSISAILQDFVLKILKTKGLADKICNEDAKTAIEGRLALFAKSMSSIGIALVDMEDEDFEKKQSPVSGLSNLHDKIIEDVCGAAETPRSRLFSQQMGKMAGATEETRRYFDTATAFQNKHLSDPMARTLTLLLLNKNSVTRGKIPKDWTYSFNSLWEPDEKTKEETKRITAESDKIYIENSVVSPEEVAKSRFPKSGYSNETINIDFELRKEFDLLDEPDEDQ